MVSAITDYYDSYDEEGRLSRDNGHQIEWITTMAYFKKLFKQESYILDGCAGTGNYSFPLAELGHKVVAGDLVPHHLELIREKQSKHPVLTDIYTGSITDLSRFDSEIFDVVLNMGAFYHIGNEDRQLAMTECLRVLKPGGLLAVSYINNAAVSLLGVGDRLGNMEDVLTWHANQTKDGLFLHMSPSEMEHMAAAYHTEIVAHIGTDGVGYLFAKQINEAQQEDFERWLQLHLRTCEDKSLLGYSLHALAILRKG
ncbi:methyltransferase type 11 [Paenibacillus sp. FSL R7-277]|uniref:class I SAM-dependent methyltransferase n=1 Tax=Paenibacillus sp. FSL P2-0089 TaxID=2954526 RepID=UPI0003E2B1F7|nr:methyltransferase type 11 [Paenibacillus sp. FSL R7-277]